MNCPQIQISLNDYLDGDLAPETQAQIKRHLDECQKCHEELEELRSLLARAEKLPSEIRPAKDLWPGIVARIDQQRSRESFWWLQLAAAAIALAVLSVPLSVWWVGRQVDDTSAQAPVEVDERFVTRQAELARLEDGVLLARTDLVRAIEIQRSVLEEDTLQILEDNMVLLDQAIGELRTALAADPQNLRLRMFLASRYQQERKLLQKVSRV